MRSQLILREHADIVADQEGPFALVLSAKLSQHVEVSADDASPIYSTKKKSIGLNDFIRDRTTSRRNSDGLGIARLQYKFVLDSGVLFLFSNAIMKSSGRSSVVEEDGVINDGSSGSSTPRLLDSFPLSICHVAIDPPTLGAHKNTLPSLSLFSSVGVQTWLITLYFKKSEHFNLWKETLIYQCASSSADSSTSTVPLSSPTGTGMGTGTGKGMKRVNTYSNWVSSSPRPPALSATDGQEALRRSRQDLLTISKQLRNNVDQRHQKSFLSQLKATTHLFGCEVGWRTLKLVDEEGDVDTSKHGHHEHHTNATRQERMTVQQDQEFLTHLSNHSRLRAMALADDSPQFQKYLQALQEQVRGVKHNSQKLINSSSSYFAAGKAFVLAGHQFAQDMLKFAPYQKDEWELNKGMSNVAKTAKSKMKNLHLSSNSKTLRNLEEDDTKTRKLQIITEELTLLIREGLVHLDVLLGQQEEILIKPLEHLVAVQSKVCKQSKERYDREKKLYLSALSKYQSMKKGDVQKRMQFKKEVDLHASIFEDARFECALKLGTFDATRDTRYLEQLAQCLHVQLSFFTHGEHNFGVKSPFLLEFYKALARANETCDTDSNLLKKEHTQWKISGKKNDKKASTAEMFGTGSLHAKDGTNNNGNTQSSPRGRGSLCSLDTGTLSTGNASPIINRAAFKEGFLMVRSKRWKNKWKRRWFTCDGRQFFYCKTAAQDAVRAMEIDLTMASIRLARNVARDFCFEVVSSALGGGMRVMVLQAESADEMNDWIKTVSTGISAQLDALLPSDVSGTGASSGGNGSSAEGDAQRERQLTVITETPGNDKCADCNNMEGVEWCSLNLGVVLCLECAGVHRGLGVHISQCRSFKLDVMDESILSMFASIGNTVANQVWEETLQTVQQDLINIPEQGGFGGSGSFDASIKPTASSTRKEKETYVKNKYVERLYVNRTTQDNAEEIGTALIDAAAKGDMKKLVRHVAWKTNLDYVSVHGATALSAAAHRGHPAPITLLLLNHADVNKCGDAGWSPLHAAAYGGKNEAVRLLMAKGANEYATEQHGATPIDIAIRCEKFECLVLMGGSVPEGGFEKKGGGARNGNTEDGHENGDGHGNGSESGSGSGNGTRKVDDGTEPRFRKKSKPRTLRSSRSERNSQQNSNAPSNEVTNPLSIATNIRNAARRSSIRRASPREVDDGSTPRSFKYKQSNGDVVVAMFDFQAESPGEISLTIGSKYIVLKIESSSGWSYGQNEFGEKGLFPTQYVEKLETL